MINFIVFGLLIAIFAYLFRVPRSLNTFPRVSFWNAAKYILTGKPIDEYYQDVLEPALKNKGYATIFNFGKWEVTVTRPEIVHEVFRNTDKFCKTIRRAQGLLGEFLGQKNIPNSNAEDRKRFRKSANLIAHQTFYPEMFAPCIEEALDVISDEVNSNPGETIQASRLMRLMSLDILGKGAFSVDLEAVKSNGSSRPQYLYSSIMSQIGSPLYSIIPLLESYPMGNMAKAYNNVHEFNKHIKGLVHQRRKDIEENKINYSKDLLSILMRKSDSSDQDGLTDEEIVHNLNSFFVAGHDTTANSLACEMYHLAKNPNIQEKLRKEIFAILKIGSNPSKLAIPTIDQIKDMEYLELFIKEAMRVNPPIAEISRVLNDDYIIPGDDVMLPKGLRVNVSIYGIHHDPKIYQNPEKFDPERFLNGKYDTDVYMPFGGGNRMCIGSNFSLMEQKLFLVMLLQKFKVDIKPENPDFEKLRIRGTVNTKPEDLNLNFVPVF